MGRLRAWRRERALSRARKRAQRASSDELRWWVQTAMTEINRAARHNDAESLREALEHTETLYCILEELFARVSTTR